MSRLIPPHGGKGLVDRRLTGEARQAELARAATLPQLPLTDQEKGDLIMLGIGGFSPLTGFMTRADWEGVVERMLLADGTFWPVPVLLSVGEDDAAGVGPGASVALVHRGTVYATMEVTERFSLAEADLRREAELVYKGAGPDSAGDNFWRIAPEEHPGVKLLLSRRPVCLAGPITLLSEGDYPTRFPGVYLRPAETRALFTERGWSDVAALQLRNPMHRSHEYLCKIAVEVCDGVIIHSLIGNVKAGDIPADVRIRCIDAVVKNYFVDANVVQGGYPLDMRYAGPREALLHAAFRQNYGVSRMIVGRDHAGVGDFYDMFEAQEIFERMPYADGVSPRPGQALLCRPLKFDWTFYCRKCDGMASLRTCPHTKADRVILSGTKLRKILSEGGDVPEHFGRPEALEILRAYYAGLEDKVAIKLHGAATGAAFERGTP